MKYFVEEITVMKDGSAPAAIYEKNSEREARSAFHQAMSSALINENVVSIHAQAKIALAASMKTGRGLHRPKRRKAAQGNDARNERKLVTE